MIKNTSWQSSSATYNRQVGQLGSHYHQALLIPAALRLLGLQGGDSLLDLGCGQGVFSRHLPSSVKYHGLDLSTSLIKLANKYKGSSTHRFDVFDLTKPYRNPASFTHALFLLSLQNISDGRQAILNASTSLKSGGKLLLILNHPCFRIPRQSSWEIDSSNKIQYRRINRYLTPLEIPMQSNPSQGIRSAVTWNYHHSLSTYFNWLQQAGFHITTLEEYGSDKESLGKAAKMENRSRVEIPLFLSILAVKS